MDNYKIFAELKNKNIKREKIIELFSHLSRQNEEITDLKRHNKDLLFFACFNDNETLFEYLTDNYKDSFQSTYKECIFFTYINRSPKILEIALNSLPTLTKEEKTEYIQRFSLNCYRKENVEIVTFWINKNLDLEEKKMFIKNIYEYNNKPFLEYVSTDPTLKELVLNFPLDKEPQLQIQQYLKRYSSQAVRYLNSIVTNESTEQEQPQNQKENNLLDLTSTESSDNNLIIRRKKRLLNKEV